MQPTPLIAAMAIALAPLGVRSADVARAGPPEPVVPPSTAWRTLEAEAPAAWTFLRADGTVHQALQRWSREAGWQLVWEVERDFPIDAEVTLRGNLLDVLNQTMAALRDTDFPLQARIQAETRVVRIGRYLPDGARR
nr:toxin co-regulated pilus biosynthesis Q family protein [uncultured Roseateles sp.]